MKSIKTQLIIFIFSVVAIVAAVMTTVAVIGISSVSKNSFNEFVVPLAEQCSSTISTYIDGKVREVDVTAHSNDIVLAKSNFDIVTYFHEIEKNTTANDYAYFDASGSILTSSSVKAVNYNTLDAFQQALESKSHEVSTPFFDENGNSYFVIITPIYKSSSELLGTLAMSFDYTPINDIVNNIQFGTSGRAYLIDYSGAYLTSKDLSVVQNGENPIISAQTDKSFKSLAKLHENIISTDLTDEEAEKSGLEDFKKDSQNHIAGYSVVNGIDSFLVISAPTRDFFKMSTFVLLFLGIAVVMLALSGFFAYIMAKKIANPLIGASERLRALSEGNLSDPVNVSSNKNELGTLTQSLSDTVLALRNYVNVITASLVNIADGNLTDRVHGSFKGDFVKIKSTFNTIIESLIDTFTNINTSADQVSSGAAQVSDGAQALSQGATEQASSIQELSSTIADISEQISSNAKASKTAAEIVSSNSKSIDLCNNEMHKMLSAMDEINDSSNEISKIIKVIDDIAFQTNILALNAAVEAARAGQAGRGFAVVADEVRNLAAKSAEAAKQTTSLISGSIASVGKGTVIANDTARTLERIVEETEEINRLVSEISSSSENQALYINEVNTGVDQVSGVVQTNTATAEESAAASEELSGQSVVLKNMIAKFRLGDKQKLFGANSFASSGSLSAGKSQYSFDNSQSAFKFESIDDDAPATEFKFGGSFDDDAPAPEFKFGGSFEDDAPASEFKFGGSFDDDAPAPEFKFGGSFEDDAPASEFKFGGSFDDDAPAPEFKFGGSFDDDAPATEFKFGGSFDDDAPAPEFKFGGSFDDDAPAPEFKFGGSFDDDAPATEFKFGGSFDDDAPAPEFKFSGSFDDDDGKY